MTRSRSRLLLAIVQTDSTFEQAELAGRPIWSGKCLHCNARLLLELSGAPIGAVTVEHIRPRAHGGTDAPENLGLACARCNHQKGTRQDSRRKGDGRLEAYVQKLLERRQQRWRSPAGPGSEEAPPSRR